MAKMRKVDSYVVLGELQFYNCLNCPWSPNVSPEKTKEVEVVNASLPGEYNTSTWAWRICMSLKLQLVRISLQVPCFLE